MFHSFITCSFVKEAKGGSKFLIISCNHSNKMKALLLTMLKKTQLFSSLFFHLHFFHFLFFPAHANTAFHVTNVTFKQANHHIYGADLSMEGGRETEICVRFSEATRSWRVRLMSRS